MPRRRKQQVKVNNVDSLEGLMQETYTDACLQIIQAQSSINELTNGTTAQDVDDATKIAKEKGGLLKVKDSAIRIKLEIAKLQSDIIKHRGDLEATIHDRTDGKASVDDFKSIRELLKKDKDIPSMDENDFD